MDSNSYDMNQNMNVGNNRRPHSVANNFVQQRFQQLSQVSSQAGLSNGNAGIWYSPSDKMGPQVMVDGQNYGMLMNGHTDEAGFVINLAGFGNEKTGLQRNESFQVFPEALVKNEYDEMVPSGWTHSGFSQSVNQHSNGQPLNQQSGGQLMNQQSSDQLMNHPVHQSLNQATSNQALNQQAGSQSSNQQTTGQSLDQQTTGQSLNQSAVQTPVGNSNQPNPENSLDTTSSTNDMSGYSLNNRSTMNTSNDEMLLYQSNMSTANNSIILLSEINQPEGQYYCHPLIEGKHNFNSFPQKLPIPVTPLKRPLSGARSVSNTSLKMEDHPKTSTPISEETRHFSAPDSQPACKPAQNTRANDEKLLVQAKTSIAENVSLKEFAQRLNIIDNKVMPTNISQKELVAKERSKTAFAIRCLLDIAETAEFKHVPGTEPFAAIARASVYNCYSYFCRVCSVPPLGQSALGKLVRVCWPNIQTKRLGTRGNSKYHYIGIKFKPLVKLMLDKLSNVSAADGLSASLSSDADALSLISAPPSALKIQKTLVQLPANGFHTNNEEEARQHKRVKLDANLTPYLSTINLALYFPIDFTPLDTSMVSLPASQKYKSLLGKNKLVKSFRALLLKGDHQNFVQLMIEQNNTGSVVFDLLVYFHSLTCLSSLGVHGVDDLYLRNLKNFSLRYLACFKETLSYSDVSERPEDDINETRIQYSCIFVQILNRLVNASQLAVSVGKFLSDKNNIVGLEKDWDLLSSAEDKTKLNSPVLNLVYAEIDSPEDRTKWETIVSKSWPGLLKKIHSCTVSFNQNQQSPFDSDKENKTKSARESHYSQFSPHEEEILKNMGLTTIVSSKLNSLNRCILLGFVKFIVNAILLQFSENSIKLNLLVINLVFDKIINHIVLSQAIKSPKKHNPNTLKPNTNMDGISNMPNLAGSQWLHPKASSAASYNLAEKTIVLNWWKLKCYMDEFLKFYCELYGLEVQINNIKSTLEHEGNLQTLNKVNNFFS